MGIIIDIWDALLLQPMLNALIFLYGVLASNFGLSIIAFTHRGSHSHVPADPQAAERLPSHVRPPAEDPGDPAEVRQGLSEGHPGDHEAVQGTGSEPHRVFGPDVRAASHMDWPLSIDHPGHAPEPGAPCRSLSEAVLMAPRRPHRHTPEQGIPLVRPLGARPH